MSAREIPKIYYIVQREYTDDNETEIAFLKYLEKHSVRNFKTNLLDFYKKNEYNNKILSFLMKKFNFYNDNSKLKSLCRQEINEDYMKKSFKNKDNITIFMANESQTEIYGVITVSFEPSYIYVDLLCSTGTKKNVGKTLLKLITDFADETRMIVELHPINSAIKYYKNLHFEGTPVIRYSRMLRRPKENTQKLARTSMKPSRVLSRKPQKITQKVPRASMKPSRVLSRSAKKVPHASMKPSRVLSRSAKKVPHATIVS
jgi:hypothetical protein